MIDSFSLFEDQCLGFQNIANHLRQIAITSAHTTAQKESDDAATVRDDHGSTSRIAVFARHPQTARDGRLQPGLQP